MSSIDVAVDLLHCLHVLEVLVECAALVYAQRVVLAAARLRYIEIMNETEPKNDEKHNAGPTPLCKVSGVLAPTRLQQAPTSRSMELRSNREHVHAKCERASFVSVSSPLSPTSPPRAH